MARDSAAGPAQNLRLLGDTPERSYATKLEHFGRFIEPDLRRIFPELDLPPHGTVLDLGCGTGVASAVLAEQLEPEVRLVSLDLSMPHLLAARGIRAATLIQADMEQPCFADRVFDFIWSCNTINHAAEPVAVVRALRRSLAPGGCIAIAQSGLLPEMFFAWDAHLDDAVRRACHSYYRERYGLSCESTAGIRGLIGILLEAGFVDVYSRTFAIERVQPLSETDRDYFRHAVFEGLWGEKVRPYLDAESFRRLEAACDPGSREYCLDRPDFHHIQTLTVCRASVRPET